MNALLLSVHASNTPLLTCRFTVRKLNFNQRSNRASLAEGGRQVQSYSLDVASEKKTQLACGQANVFKTNAENTGSIALEEKLTADDGSVPPAAAHSQERLWFERSGVAETRLRAVLYISLTQLPVAVGPLTGEGGKPAR